MIDPKKLKAFAQGRYPMGLSLVAEPVLTPGETEEIQHALQDDLGEDAQNMRKLQRDVSYLEFPEPIGVLACGNCKYLKENSFCGHASVRADVSADSGHCNFWWTSPASAALPIFPEEEPTLSVSMTLTAKSNY